MRRAGHPPCQHALQVAETPGGAFARIIACIACLSHPIDRPGTLRAIMPGKRVGSHILCVVLRRARQLGRPHQRRQPGRLTLPVDRQQHLLRQRIIRQRHRALGLHLHLRGHRFRCQRISCHHRQIDRRRSDPQRDRIQGHPRSRQLDRRLWLQIDSHVTGRLDRRLAFPEHQRHNVISRLLVYMSRVDLLAGCSIAEIPADVHTHESSRSAEIDRLPHRWGIVVDLETRIQRRDQ
jgi:hypothetical protein